MRGCGRGNRRAERVGHAASIHGARDSAGLRTRLSLMRAPLNGAKWVEPENMHITLALRRRHRRAHGGRFRRSACRNQRHPFPMSILGAGAFGGRDPRVLWAGVELAPQLEALYRANERAARAAGLEADPRNFKPHVTLARMRGVRQSAVARFPGGIRRSAHGAVHGHALRAAFGTARIRRAALWRRGRVPVRRCGCGRSRPERGRKGRSHAAFLAAAGETVAATMSAPAMDTAAAITSPSR